MSDKTIKHLDTNDVPILVTIVRTITLTSLTVLFIFAIRSFPVFAGLVNKIFGLPVWSHLYMVLHVDTARGREQIMMTLIIAACFILALTVQLACVSLWRVLTSRTQRGRTTTE